MCNRDLDNLRRWRPNEYLSPQRAEVLTPQGVEDMKLLARRLQSNFPELLQPNYFNITSANYKVSLHNRLLLYKRINIDFNRTIYIFALRSQNKTLFIISYTVLNFQKCSTFRDVF